jgi:hypothetical protein
MLLLSMLSFTALESITFCTSMVCLSIFYYNSMTKLIKRLDPPPAPLSNAQELLFHIRRQLLQSHLFAATFYNLLQVTAQGNGLPDKDTNAFLERWPTFIPISRVPSKAALQGVRIQEMASPDQVELDQELWSALDAANKV